MSATGHSLRRARQRAVASLVILLSWGTLALSFVHQATSQHRFCAEHGALEEVATGGEGADVAAALAFAMASGVPVTEAEAHEACPFDCAMPTDRVRVAVHFASALIPEGPAIDRALDLEIGAPLDLLLLAPKNSPPQG